MVSDRLSKEELKEDRVITAANQAVEYARKNARWVVAAVVVLVAGIVAAVLIAQGRVSSERQASLSLLRGQGLYANGNYADAATEFGNLASQHGGTAAGRLARLYLGNSQLAMGNSGAAEASFRQALSGRGLDAVSQTSARRGLAAAYAAQSKFAEAAAEYLNAAKVDGNPLAADDWFHGGLAFLRAGNNAEAIRALGTLLEKYPRSQPAPEARIRLKELQAK